MEGLAALIYLGCYADAQNPLGLKTVELDTATGEMRITSEHRVSNAIYQAVSPDGKTLYSCTGDGLASFQLAADGSIAERTDEIALGKCVCHVAAMQDGKHVVFADYTGGFAGSVEVSGGRFANPVLHRHEGCGPNLPRQSHAHCHQALPTPDGKSYCVVDLGLDEVVMYPEGRVFKTSPVGAGPRHLAFHPNGRFAFLSSELGNLVSVLSWSDKDGFRLIASLPTREHPDPSDITASDSTNLAAAIRLSPDMKRVIVSNRGENSLVAYDFDETTGQIKFKARTKLDGSWPRDFIFVDETLVLVAMERSGEIISLRYDSMTGAFVRLSALRGLNRPVSLLHVSRKAR